MSLIFANILGWIVSHWKTILYVAAGLIVLFLVIFTLRSCLAPKPVPIDEKKVLEIQQAIETQNRTQVKESAAEIKVKQQVIDNDLSGNVKAIENAEQSAKARVDSMTNAELTEFLESQVNQ